MHVVEDDIEERYSEYEIYDDDEEIYDDETYSNEEWSIKRIFSFGIDNVFQQTIYNRSSQLQRSIDHFGNSIKIAINGYVDSVINTLPFDFIIKFVIKNVTDKVLDGTKRCVKNIIMKYEYKITDVISTEFIYIKKDLQEFVVNYMFSNWYDISNTLYRPESRIINFFYKSEDPFDESNETEEVIGYLGLTDSQYNHEY